MIFLDHPFILSSYKLKKCAKNKQQSKLTKLFKTKEKGKKGIDNPGLVIPPNTHFSGSSQHHSLA
jgi:hypothetical protein